MGERERLEQAIAALEAQRATLGDGVVDASVAALRKELAALEPPPPAGPQRKQVTVLFADISGFTALGEAMDAEEVSELVNALWARLDQIIADHGGYIDKHMGDAVMALWGVQAAREDDAEQAIRAALAMRLSDLQSPTSNLHLRIGISTGPVLLGEVGTTGEYTAIGDAVNLASRLQHAAPEGGILVAHDAYRHVRGLFDVQALPSIAVKGKAEPVRVYLVEQAKPRGFRMSTRGVEGVETRMIGRDAELFYLQDALRAVMGGERRMVTIVGEAGVGKSRLLYEFENWAELLPEELWYFKGRATWEMQKLPYALVRDLFAFRFMIRDSDRASVVREKMERGIGETLGEDESGRTKAHFVGQLLGFDFSDSPYLREALADSRQLRERGLACLSEYFHALAAQTPIVLLLEDVHWADDSSLDVLNRLGIAMPNQPLLIVCLARPALLERYPRWGDPSAPGGSDFHTRLELRPLSKDDSRRLVEEILQKVDQVPDALRELVVSGAEGNPFYVEELIKMLVEDGVIVTGEERWRVEPARLTAVRVPPTLAGVLQARLDGLSPEERTVLQQASVVGRLFWDSTVMHISESAQEAGMRGEIPRTLSALRGKEMVFRRQTSAFAGAQEYIFKHALLREVTYESVLRRLRRIYHGLVAEWLIAHSAERLGEYAGLIADHLELAGQAEQALIYLRRAGDEAAARFANVEAIGYYSRALALISPADLAGCCDLLVARERVYEVMAARDAQLQDIVAMEQMADALDDNHRRAEAALRRTIYNWAQGDFAGAIAEAQTAIRIAESVNDTDRQAMGYFLWGRNLWSLGNNEEARERLKRALDLARAAGMRQVEADALRNLGNIHSYESDSAVARDYFEQALSLHRQIGDRRGEASALNSLGLMTSNEGDHVSAGPQLEQALSICQEMGNRYLEAMVTANLGEVHRRQGDYAAARRYYEQALHIRREIGDRDGEGDTLAFLGNVAYDQRDLAHARDFYEQALAIAHQTGNRWCENWALGGLGRIAFDDGRYVEALARHEQALAVCREMGNRRGEGEALYQLERVFYNLGDDERTAACGEQALLLVRELGDRGYEGWALTAMALLLHRQGDDARAFEVGQQALSIGRELSDRALESRALVHSGHALVGLGRLIEAAEAYRQALATGREERPDAGVDILAGLARVSLARGDPLGARAYVEEILAQWKDSGLVGAEESMRVYLTCCQVLHANGDPRAGEVLAAAHGLLQEWAGQIEDGELRRAFLENVPANREIVALFSAAG